MEAFFVQHLLMRISPQVPEADEWCSSISSSDLKDEFQTPETTCDLLYTLLGHQPSFPLWETDKIFDPKQEGLG